MSGQQHAPAALYPRERHGTHFTGGWVGPRAGLDGWKISSPQGFDRGPSSPYLSRYTDWATRPTTLYTIICKHTELLSDINNTVFISCYGLTFTPCLKKKSLRGRWQAHYVPNIAHFKLLSWSDKNAFSGRSFNAVSLGVPSTWPPELRSYNSYTFCRIACVIFD